MDLIVIAAIVVIGATVARRIITAAPYDPGYVSNGWLRERWALDHGWQRGLRA